MHTNVFAFGNWLFGAVCRVSSFDDFALSIYAFIVATAIVIPENVNLFALNSCISFISSVRLFLSILCFTFSPFFTCASQTQFKSNLCDSISCTGNFNIIIQCWLHSTFRMVFDLISKRFGLCQINTHAKWIYIFKCVSAMVAIAGGHFCK